MQTQLHDHYQLIVLGLEPAALLMGALAAKLGLRVLMIPHLREVKGVASSRQEFWYDLESNSIAQARADSGGLFSECLKKLEIQSSELEHFTKSALSVSVASLTHRFTVNSDFLRSRSMLESEFDAESSYLIACQSMAGCNELDWTRIWQNLPRSLTFRGEPRGREKKRTHAETDGPAFDVLLNERWKKAKTEKLSLKKVRKFESKMAQNQYLDDYLALRALLFSELGQDLGVADRTFKDVVQALGLSPLRAQFKGGLSALRSMLSRIAMRHGAHVIDDKPCSRVFTRAGIFQGVQVSGAGRAQGKMISTDFAVLGNSMLDFFDICEAGDKALLTAKNRHDALVSIDHCHFTLALKVNARAIQEGYANRVYWCEEGAPLIEVEIWDPVRQFGSLTSESRMVFVRTPVPKTVFSDKQALRILSARLYRHVCEIFPFLENHIELYFDGGLNSIPDRPMVYGLSNVDYYPDKVEKMWDPCRMIWGKGVKSETGIERLYAVSRESYPELGPHGAIKSAIEVLSVIAHHNGIRGPFG